MKLACTHMEEDTVIYDRDNGDAYIQSNINCADYLLLSLDDLPQ